MSAASDVKMQDIVSIDPNGDEKVVKSSKPYDPAVAGIISTDPGLLIGKNDSGSKPLALSGRVPVKVSLINGEIKRGDPITTSNIPGVGMKATEPGAVVGKAMQNLTEDSAIMSCPEGAPADAKCGIIVVLVNVSWHDPRFATLTINDQESWAPGLGTWTSDVQVSEDGTKTNNSFFDSILSMFKNAFEIVFEKGVMRVANIITEKLTAKEFCLEEICMSKTQFKELLEKNGIILPSTESTISETALEPTPDATSSTSSSQTEPAPEPVSELEPTPSEPEPSTPDAPVKPEVGTSTSENVGAEPTSQEGL